LVKDPFLRIEFALFFTNGKHYAGEEPLASFSPPKLTLFATGSDDGG
jgi:hypothetical protein